MADFEVNRRLKKLITEVYKTTPFDFSKKYNDAGGVKTSAIMRERNGVSNNMLDAICSAYPEINRSWLLTGEGQMLNPGSSTSGPNSPIVSGHDNFFDQKSDCTEIIRAKDELIGQLRGEVEYLRNLANNLMRSKDAER